MSLTPRISGIIPNYNYGRYVTRAVDSLLSQELPPGQLEVIVVDDASTDDSWANLERYRDDPRVVLVRHPANAGIAASWNDGIRLSRGRYILALDSDDFAIEADALPQQAALLDGHPEAGLVFVDHIIVDEDDAPLGYKRARVPSRMMPHEAFRRLMIENFITHSGVLLRRECIEQVGGYDPDFVFNQDLELWLRVATRWELLHVSRPLFAYRFHKKSMFFRTVDRDFALDAFRQVLDRAATYSPLPNTAAIANEALAHGHLMRAVMLLSRGEYVDGLRDIGSAITMRPRSLFDRALARAALLLVLRLTFGERMPLVTGSLRRRLYAGRALGRRAVPSATPDR